MGRFLAGSIAALLLVAAGLVWWQGRDAGNRASLVAQPLPPPKGDDLPEAGDPNAMGEAPPLPPGASPRTREQKRFDRYDRDRDNLVTRNEMLATRVAEFRRLDTDHNNLLSFEEWAVKTSTRFAGADANKDGKLTRAEFATTAMKHKAAGACVCGKGGKTAKPEPEPDEE